ncbi:MAG: helix-turn-helix domain-containing protein [Acidibrevibacterium sp.]|jgi:putative transcriptional regulator|uniref:helix-turn-helix domain-containing protein n=1 Tax=Acidibrevibacterium fodinaquatile TaxID=1969806 RepID=UPI0023A88850|nr:helix-turn-helix domain-containing protein [Acidibrevibacterium fodinaquatile]MCA7120919.1 helix-turn-helix domain-containing protein [Acidibrevibacterium fodinaquatile]
MTRVKARLREDGHVARLLADGSESPMRPQADWSRIDATTEDDIARHQAEDDAEAREDAAAWARHVRHKVGLSQDAFAARLGLPVATVRNWEQGKRLPRGPARALLRILAKAPETALAALAPE